MTFLDTAAFDRTLESYRDFLDANAGRGPRETSPDRDERRLSRHLVAARSAARGNKLLPEQIEALDEVNPFWRIPGAVRGGWTQKVTEEAS